MSDSVIIAIVIAAVVLVVLYLFRGSLSRFFLKAGPDGLETELEAHQKNPNTSLTNAKSDSGESIKGNKMFGSKNKISVGQEDVSVQDNYQIGEKQEIIVQKESKKTKKK